MAGGREEGNGEVVLRREEEEEEDYIDMDLSSAVAREFEFMSAPLDRWGEPVASPADELFYKGKLLPLHLPPRIQMVEELLDGRAAPRSGGGCCRDREALGFRTAPATPYESCTASPANNSCYAASGELNVEEYFQEYAAGLATAAAAAGERKTAWSKKLRFVRQLNLGLKLKASKAYLKTIFAAAKQGSPEDKQGVLGASARGAQEQLGHGGHGHGHLSRAWRKSPFGGQVRSNRCIASSAHGGGGGSRRATPTAEREPGHRRSFSSVIVRYSAAASNKTASPAAAPPPSMSSCSSSSSSSSSVSSSSSSVRTSSESDEGAGPALRRSSSASSEVENPIQGLIAYCKRSQQLASVRKSASDAGFRFLSSAASKIAAESDDDGLDELIEVCRG
ncbi:unnamed protein product [Urochloa decumbens]|uniref:Membrane-associated kinase regulator 4 n=1 Tax=Urochloa decumbens TaxID=240449 RepID=A0ABC8VN87_9POAL